MTGLAGPDPDLIEDAAHVLFCRGHAEPGDDGYVPDELVDQLVEVWQAGPCEECPRTLDGYMMADHWLAARQAEWERSLPTWACDCGAVYKPLAEYQVTRYFLIAVDGRLGDARGSVRVDGKGRVRHSDECAGCGRRFSDALAAQAGGQPALF